MSKEEIIEKVKGMNQDDAAFALFYVIITQNGYYDNIRKYGQSYEGGIAQVAAELCDKYEKTTDWLTQYRFLDTIEDTLASDEANLKMRVDELVDSIEWEYI